MADKEPPAQPEPPPEGEDKRPAFALPPAEGKASESLPAAAEEPLLPPLELDVPAEPPPGKPGRKAKPPKPPKPPKGAKPPKPDGPEKPPRKKRSWLKTLAVWAALLVFVFPIGLTIIYRFVPPPITLTMIGRLFEGRGLKKSWRPLSQISPSLPQAVIAAEDARFCEHRGFDFEAIEQALENNRRRPNRMRGGSTISQQTAKNVFASQDRNLVRKGVETYFTVLIEALWGKKRIMEVYLNVAEWGPGIYGAQAAARHYFKVDAKNLTRAQSARLAAILPSPLRWRAVSPGPYVQRRSRRIGAASVTVRETDLSDCLR